MGLKEQIKKKSPRAVFESQVMLGERYRDEQSGFEGVATAVYFFQYACERVAVETFDKSTSQLRTETFDAPRLTHIDTAKRLTATRTGGPGDGNDGIRPTIAPR